MMEFYNVLIYQVRKADGAFRFIITNDEQLAYKNLCRDEQITDIGKLQGVLGGDVQFIIETN